MSLEDKRDNLFPSISFMSYDVTPRDNLCRRPILFVSLEDKRTNLFRRILFMSLEDKRDSLFTQFYLWVMTSP